MKQTDETNHFTFGLPNISAASPKAKLRLAGLTLTALLGTVLVCWISRKTWDRVDGLQHEFSGLKADSFYLGVRLRGQIQTMNDTLLRYRLRGEIGDYDDFRTGTATLKNWLEESQSKASVPLERNFLKEIGGAYDDYLIESMKVLEANRNRWLSSQAKDFKDSYEKVQNQSKRLLELCNTFIANQRSAFDNFLSDSSETLTSFKQLLRLSLGLLLSLAAALVFMFYRGMIAPLRLSLTESQAIIARQEKLASLGVLAAGVAHEIRNPLTAIKFRLFSLKKSLPATGAENEDALVIGNEINRLERIVKDFLQFARPSEPELVDLPVERLLNDVHHLLRPQLDKAAIALEIENTKEFWVRADSQQIKQVLINLVQNSAESIGSEGRITLKARPESGSGRKANGDSVVVEVVDNGKGIPPEVQKRLFDPFFSTKEGGTGLGLPIAARIIEKHGGALRYETQLDHGTTFAIVLPRLKNHETKDIAD